MSAWRYFKCLLCGEVGEGGEIWKHLEGRHEDEIIEQYIVLGVGESEAEQSAPDALRHLASGRPLPS